MGAAKLAETYFQYFRTKSRDYRWAYEDVDDSVRNDPIKGWELTKLLIDRAESDEALAFVAAGPLENLMINGNPEVMDRIEKESQTNQRLQLALSGVWLSPEYASFERWHALMTKFGFADGKRLPL